MSLIRVRRNRKREWIDVKKGKPPFKLGLLLVVVIGVIWYLNGF
jgi:hypothetical protein